MRCSTTAPAHLMPPPPWSLGSGYVPTSRSPHEIPQRYCPKRPPRHHPFRFCKHLQISGTPEVMFCTNVAYPGLNCGSSSKLRPTQSNPSTQLARSLIPLLKKCSTSQVRSLLPVASSVCTHFLHPVCTSTVANFIVVHLPFSQHIGQITLEILGSLDEELACIF